MPKKQDFSFLTRGEIDILKNSNAGAAFDAVEFKNQVKNDIKHVESKTNISSQNPDTGLPSYNADDTRPYEQKNTSAGFHKSGMGSK